MHKCFKFFVASALEYEKGAQIFAVENKNITLEENVAGYLPTMKGLPIAAFFKILTTNCDIFTTGSRGRFVDVR